VECKKAVCVNVFIAYMFSGIFKATKRRKQIQYPFILIHLGGGIKQGFGPSSQTDNSLNLNKDEELFIMAHI